MLRTFAVALLATSLIGGAAVAAESGNAGATAPAQTTQIKPASAAAYKQARGHVGRTTHQTKVTHHVKGKPHKSQMVHVRKGGKQGDKQASRVGVKTAKLPTSRAN